MKNKPQQTLKSRDEFIQFFRRIPKKKWTTGGQFCEHGRCCAYGHLGVRFSFSDSPSAQQLRQLETIHPSGRDVVATNDRRNDQFPQRSAKDRVIAWLKALSA